MAISNFGYSKYLYFLPAIVLFFLNLYIAYQYNRMSLGGDQFHWVYLIDEYFKGTISIKDYFVAHGSHSVPGYKTVLLLNAKLFGLDPRIEVFIGTFSRLIISVLMVLYLLKYVSNKALVVISCFLIPILISNPNIYSSILGYSLISMRSFNLLGFCAIFILLAHLYRTNFKNTLLTFILILLIFLFSLFFGRGWGQAMLLTVAATSIVGIFKLGTPFKKPHYVLLAISLICMGCMFYYMREHVSSNVSRNIGVLLPVDFLKFSKYFLTRILTAQEISVTSSAFFWVSNTLGWALVFGAISSILYILFFARRFEANFLPFILMVFGFACVTIVFIERGLTAPNLLKGASWPRHYFESCMIFVGFCLFVCQTKWRNRIAVWISSSAFVLLFVWLAMTLSAEVSRSVYVRVYYEHQYNAFFGDFSEFQNPKIVKNAGCHNTKLCIKSRKIIDKYNLLPRK